MYLTLESESDHADRVGEPTHEFSTDEDKRSELSRRLLPENVETVRRAFASTSAQSLICSCGSYVCPMILSLGLPVAVYEVEIKPLATQGARDRRARELRA